MRDGHNGFIFDLEIDKNRNVSIDVKNLKNAVTRAIGYDNDRLNKIRLLNYETVKKLYSIDRMIDDTIKYYRDIIYNAKESTVNMRV